MGLLPYLHLICLNQPIMRKSWEEATHASRLLLGEA
jgi:hypothetical protein